MSKLFLINVLLAIAWVAINGAFTFAGLLFGFVLGALALWVIREQTGTQSYFRRGGKIIKLIAVFLYEVLMSGLRVARMVMSPKMGVQPALFAYPLRVDEDWEITLLANLITLTPGTLSVDVSRDEKILYVHVINTTSIEQEKATIRDGFEQQILEISRP